jgi:tetratricopeptide (TPR) repeat protein
VESRTLLLRIRPVTRPDLKANPGVASWPSASCEKGTQGRNQTEQLFYVVADSADQALLMEAQAIDQVAKGHVEDALITLRQLTSSNSSNVDSWYFLADISLDAADLDESGRALSRCLALSPRDPLCTYDHLLLLEKTNRFEDSISGYKEALSAGIKYPWIEEAAGYAELGLGNLEGARQHFDRLAGLKFQDPHDYAFQTSRDGLAAIALYSGKTSAARERLRSALETSRSKYERATYELMLAQVDALVGRASDAQKEAVVAVEDSSAGDIAMGAAEAMAMAGDFVGDKELLKKRGGEGPALGRRYAAVNEFVRALEALKAKHSRDAADLLYNSFAGLKTVPKFVPSGSLYRFVS